MMNEDGSATILEKDFDSRTFFERYLVRKTEVWSFTNKPPS